MLMDYNHSIHTTREISRAHDFKRYVLTDENVFTVFPVFGMINSNTWG